MFFFFDWSMAMIIAFLSLASMVFGAVAAIGQKFKRLIAYSSIGHVDML